ncbi:ATP-dependent DNA helicase 2 subunit KU80 isoform X2 [Cryptomeria japonica]|uniref:ATP-dependent DNA helicase 2 subunit KU80 isoform X2 n=4 Tax=Cryptomeria japonica TaxID=3369 RepID=UPI0027DA9040|nr:ATP-dependent DNA helicase 2 subunit KU80 isoform X2 [Cryptomeria japonica]XP_057869346.2 ATP-dependent DNA helicase 2 subunit KU80 isoform X2 [Cryptomeria japonica]
MQDMQESLVLLLDISPSMHNHLQDVARTVSILVKRKIFFNKSDELGLVLFGSEEANNDLQKEVGGYESVAVKRPIRVVEEDLLEYLSELPRGRAQGDFLDALVVGMDLLIKKHGAGMKGNKVNKRLYLITGARSLIKDPDEGTKEDQVDVIANQMKEHGMKLDVVVLQQRISGLASSNIFHENVSLLKRFSKRAQAEVLIVESPVSLLSAVKARNISPVTLFRGDLELTPMIRVKVWVYKKTIQERVPTLKKYSEKAPPNDSFASREVKMDFEYKSREDPDKTIPPEQRIKGFRYGPQVVPISTMEEDTLRFKPEKGLKLLCFTDTSNVPRHYYLKDTNIIVPEPGNTMAILAVSAVARAMEDTKKVAIVRCIWRQGQKQAVLGLLTPNLSSSENVADSFYLNVIPFAEDIREFPFASFNDFPPSQQPNDSQQEAADNFVRMFDLAPPGREEILQPELTLNPVLERFYSSLDAKLRNPDADVPPVDDLLMRIVEPDPEIVSENEFALNRFCSQFQLKVNPKKDKMSKRFWRDKAPLSEEVGKDDSVDLQSDISFESLAARKVEEVGGLTPVQDFEAMLARRDSDEWVPKAIREMKKLISDLLDNSYNGNTYSKALDCLLALRSGCVQQEEPMGFNNFMRELAIKCRSKRLNDFWELIVSKNLTLINKGEAADSDVTEEEAKAILAEGNAGRAPDQPPEVDEMELLLGEVV